MADDKVVRTTPIMEKFQPTEYEYEGMTLLKEAFPAWALDEIKETLLDDSDVMVVTYAKCGTTWMQEIVYQVNTEGDFEGSDNAPLHDRYNFLEEGRPSPKGPTGINRFKADTPPRYLKSHLPSKFFKKTLENRKTKFVVVFRNPKDMLVSFYNFYKMAPFKFDRNGTWEEFFDIFKKDKLVHGNYFDMQLSWWAYRDDPQVKIFHYENMLKDPVQAVRDVATFLEKDLSDELVQKIVERTSFKSMKSNPMLNYSTVSSKAMNHEVSPFMRKGQVADWQNYFSEEQKKYVDELCKKRFEPEGLFLQDEI